jgi:hypothetical protein
MSNHMLHGLFVGVSALALALAAKMARRSLISALRRAMAKRWSLVFCLLVLLWCRPWAAASPALLRQGILFARLVYQVLVHVLIGVPEWTRVWCGRWLLTSFPCKIDKRPEKKIGSAGPARSEIAV